jgi:hypothetical protein
MNEDDVQRIKQIAKEAFWEILDEDFLPILRDFVGIRLDASRVKAEEKQTDSKVVLPELTFTALKFDMEEGARLGKYEVAYKNKNLADPWQHAYNILRNNSAVINDRFHEQGYSYAYWIYPEKYEDRIFRMKLKEEAKP